MDIEGKVNIDITYSSNKNIQNPYKVLEVRDIECLLTNGLHTIWEYIDVLSKVE